MKDKVQQGFTLPEVLVAAFLLGMATVAVVGVAVFSSRSSLESERQNVALGVVNEKLEQVRVLSYEDVGLLDASLELDEPVGVVTRTETVANNQETYDVVVTITNIDDPANGTVPDGKVDEADADYKKVEVTAVWAAASGTQRQVSVVTYVAPSGALRECTPGELTCPGYAGEGACIPFELCPLSGVCPAPTDQKYFCPVEAVYCRAQTGLCTNNSQCGSGEVCNLTTGSCSLACNGPDSCECPEAFQCNTTTGICDPPSPSPSSPPSPSSSPPSSPSPSSSGSPSFPPSDPPPSDPPPSDPPPSPSNPPPSSSPLPTASVSHCPTDDPRVFGPGCENITPIDPGCGCGQRNVTTFVQQTVPVNDPLCPIDSTEQCVPVSVSQSCAQLCPSSSFLPSPTPSATVSPSSSVSPTTDPSASPGASGGPSSSPGGGSSPAASGGPSSSPGGGSSPAASGGPSSSPGGGSSPDPDPSGGGGGDGEVFDGCVTSSECGADLACIDGQCQGEQCLSETSVECGSGLQPGDVVSQTSCSCPGLSEHQVTRMQNNPVNDPQCVQTEVCQPVTTLEPCPICSSPSPTPTDITQCTDDIDNDGDGYIDRGDGGCHDDNNPFNDASYNIFDPIEDLGECQNNSDDDSDGGADTADDDCYTVPGSRDLSFFDAGNEENSTPTPSPNCTPGTTTCTDGEDNDNDGLADEFDSDCITDPSGINPQYDMCSNGEVQISSPT